MAVITKIEQMSQMQVLVLTLKANMSRRTTTEDDGRWTTDDVFQVMTKSNLALLCLVSFKAKKHSPKHLKHNLITTAK